MVRHLDPEALERLLAGELQPPEELAALAHLTECGRCAGWARPVLAASAEYCGNCEGAADYDNAIDRARARAGAARARIQRERRRVGEIRAKHEENRPLRWTDRAGWAAAEALLEASFALRYSDPAQMLALAYGANMAANHLRPDPARGAAVVADLKARARAELGNAYRINAKLDLAESAFHEAGSFLVEGTGDPLLVARVADLRATFLAARRRFSEAVELLKGAFQTYVELGERHLAGRVQTNRGIYTHYSGDAQGAIRLLEEAMPLIDAERDSRLALSVRQAFIHALVDCGQPERAGEALLQSGLRQALAGDTLSLISLRAVEGKIQLGLGHLPAAERAFSEARQGYLENGSPYKAALATLELVKVQLLLDKTDDVRQLTEESYYTFEKLGIHREAQFALGLLREVARQGRANVDFVEHTGRFLEELEHQPQLLFARDF